MLLIHFPAPYMLYCRLEITDRYQQSTSYLAQITLDNASVTEDSIRTSNPDDIGNTYLPFNDCIIDNPIDTNAPHDVQYKQNEQEHVEEIVYEESLFDKVEHFN